MGVIAALSEKSEVHLAITPNLAKDMILIDGSHALIDFVIYNLSGQVVKKGFLTDNTISVKELNQGHYILRSDIYSARFVKI